MPLESSSADAPGDFILQCWFWSAYVAALILPWLGTYTLASMLPNKLMVAATGIALTAGIRQTIRVAERRAASGRQTFAVALLASVLAGVCWDLLLSALLGRSVQFDLQHLGVIGGRFPQLGGGLYHALVLTAWSMIYLHLRSTSRGTPVPAPVWPIVPATPEPERLVLRDGKRSIVVDAGEIDWIEARGDYVRIHTGPRHLLIRATMAGAEAALGDSGYARIHRSTIVRIDRVRELRTLPNHELDVVLRDGRVLRASRTYADRLRALVGSETSLRS